jgi:hypothetical protein
MPKLPKLKPDPMFAGHLVGRFRTITGEVKISVRLEAANSEAGMELVRSSVAEIDSFERRAKSVAARDLLSVYEESWRVYKTVEDGVYKTVEGRKLDESSFGKILRLASLEVTDPTTLCLWFDTKEIFGGHSILVTFHDGSDGSCDAQLWG